MKVAITYKIPQAGIDILKKHHDVWVNEEDRALTKEELKDIFKNFDGVITMLSNKIDKEIIDEAKTLKIISNYAVGFNNIDFEYAKSKGIQVTNTPDVLTETTADLAWALLMSVSRRIVESDKFVREGNFNGWKPELFLGNDIFGKKLGIIGLGRIGKAVANRAKGFNMDVYYNKRTRLNDSEEKDLNITFKSLDFILKECDFISLHMPLTPDTHHLLNKEKLDMLKSNAILINTARGPVIDENYLVQLLKDKKIAGAGFDVYEFEPKLAEGLKDLDNVVLAPHIGSASTETRNKMAEMVANDIILVLNNENPKNSVFK